MSCVFFLSFFFLFINTMTNNLLGNTQIKFCLGCPSKINIFSSKFKVFSSANIIKIGLLKTLEVSLYKDL